MKRPELPMFRDKKARVALEKVCAERGLKLSLIQSLVEVQRDYLGMANQLGITKEFDACIEEFLDGEKRS